MQEKPYQSFCQNKEPKISIKIFFPQRVLKQMNVHWSELVMKQRKIVYTSINKEKLIWKIDINKDEDEDEDKDEDKDDEDMDKDEDEDEDEDYDDQKMRDKSKR